LGVGWLACDQRSTSGTFRDGTRIDQALVDGTAPVELRLADPTSGPTLTLRARAPSPLDSRLGPPAQPRPRLGSLSASRPLTSLLRIGRAPDNDVVLADDLTVSRHHAQLRRQGGQATIVDLGSRHGTYIDGARVTAAAVADGAVVRIGRHLFVARDGQLDTYVDDGAVLATTDLTVTVDGGRKTLLADITMAVQPGQLVAVIGPSGAGKTTLLRALTGVSPATGGTVTYNGRDLYASLDELRYRIGFVPQDDILHSQLTLRRALSYAAELRFADDTSRAERKARVDEVLAELGLDQRDGLQISNLSGGQRKRASVALELLTRPALLFLDEPTSGLDPGFERSVMQLLRELADGGRTVVVITHAVASLQLCDRVLVLASGSMAFFGPPGEILGFFGATDYARVFQLLEAGTADWAARFKAHAAYQAYVAGPARQHARRPGAAQAVGHVMWRGAGVARQIGTLVRRNVAVLAGTRGYAGLLLAQAPVMAGLLLLALGGGNLAGTPDSRPRNLLILLVTAAIAMGLVNACREIVRELAIYQRERTVGLSLGAYLISKFVYLGALAAAQSAVLTAVVVQGQKAGGDALVFGTPLAELGVILFAATFAAVALGLAVSARVSTDAAALVMIPVLLVAQLVLSHALIDVEGRPVLAATAWATPAYWAFSGAAASTDLISLEGRCGQTPVEGAPASAGPTCGSLWDPTTGNLMLSLAALTVLTLAYAAAAATALRHRDPIRL
ncbi:MAG: ATP-binding cassette domain-containing protein, partial [Egibacteraceae bacterium]